jgi:hypothetical protein
VITGLAQTIPFHRRVLADEEFKRGHLHTGFLPEFLARDTGVSSRSVDGREVVAERVSDVIAEPVRP